MTLIHLKYRTTEDYDIMANKGFVGIFEEKALSSAREIYPNDEQKAYDYAKNVKPMMAVSAATDYFTSRGYAFCVPQTDQQGFDWDALVCRPGDEVLKVSIKSAGYAKGGGSWEVNLKSGHYSKNSKYMSGGTCRKVVHDFDILFVLDGDGKCTAMTQEEALRKPDGTYKVHSVKVPRSK